MRKSYQLCSHKVLLYAVQCTVIYFTVFSSWGGPLLLIFLHVFMHVTLTHLYTFFSRVLTIRNSHPSVKPPSLSLLRGGREGVTVVMVVVEVVIVVIGVVVWGWCVGVTIVVVGGSGSHRCSGPCGVLGCGDVCRDGCCERCSGVGMGCGSHGRVV